MGLRARLLSIVAHHAPDFIIGGAEDPYLLRWYITPWSGMYRDVPDEKKTRWQKFVRAMPNVYLHLFLRSDDDRALHDHPWMFNCSILLLGNYIEWVPSTRYEYAMDSFMADFDVVKTVDPQNPVAIERKAGSWYFRWGRAIHRVELIDRRPCVTLFITGPAVREWGFWCKRGWVNWKTFTNTRDGVSTVGRGCE